MQAIVFANRHGAELHPLTTDTPAALLPIAGKPIIEYSLEDLAETPIKEIVVIVPEQDTSIATVLGDGARWGLQLHFLPSEEGSEVAALKEWSIETESPFLALRGDVLRSPMSLHFLAQTAAIDDSKISATIAGQPAYLLLYHIFPNEFDWHQSDSYQCQDLGTAKVSLLASISDYHQANIDVVAGHYPGIVPEGRHLSPWIKVGRTSQASSSNRISGKLWVGERARLHRDARCAENVVINGDAIVDAKTTLENTVVLSGSYIGHGLYVRNAIVKGRSLIRVDTKTVIEFEDASVCSDL